MDALDRKAVTGYYRHYGWSAWHASGLHCRRICLSVQGDDDARQQHPPPHEKYPALLSPSPHLSLFFKSPTPSLFVCTHLVTLTVVLFSLSYRHPCLDIHQPTPAPPLSVVLYFRTTLVPCGHGPQRLKSKENNEIRQTRALVRRVGQEEGLGRPN